MGSTFFSSLSVDTIECKTMRIEDANLTLLLDTRMPLFKFQANKQLRWNLFSLETFQTKYQHVFFKHQLKHVETALHHLIISDTDFRYIRLHGMIGLWSSHHYLIVITCIYIYTYIMHIYIYGIIWVKASVKATPMGHKAFEWCELMKERCLIGGALKLETGVAFLLFWVGTWWITANPPVYKALPEADRKSTIRSI